MPQPRILIGCPTHELKADSLDAYFEGLASLSFSDFDVILEDNSPTSTYSEKLKAKAAAFESAHPGKKCTIMYSGETSPFARARLVHGRNQIREVFLNGNYTHFLSLEQDVIPPVNMVEKLLANEKDICSGVYLNQQTRADGKHLIVMAGTQVENDADKVQHVGFLDLFPSRLVKIAYAGIGCMLISRAVLEKVKFRYDENARASDDIYFAQDAQANGFELFLDTSVLCKHLFNDAFKQTKY